MIEYKCPYCGQKVYKIVLTSYPPIIQYKCGSCSYEYTETQPVSIVTAPIPTIGGHNEKSTIGC